MRRALAILKYLLAVLCGLLVVAWVVSVNYSIESGASLVDIAVGIGLADGNISLTAGIYEGLHSGARLNVYPNRFNVHYLGYFRYYPPNFILVPIAGILAALFPLAIGPFINFRFPLWSYFAWTALVAAELAYYLR
jgi:hypothetical protein